MKAVKPAKPQLNSYLTENKKKVKKYYNEIAENKSESSLYECSQEIMEKLIEILGFVEDKNGNLLLSFQKLIELKTSEN